MPGHHDGSSTDNELAKKIRETGLDPEYWLCVLEEKLGINNIHSMQYVQTADCSALEENTRFPWEKRALRKLFSVTDSSTDIKNIQEKQCQVMKEKNQQALKIINELNKLRSEGKDRNNEMVKQREEEIRKALEIPSECSAPPENSLLDLIDHYEKQITFMEESLKKQTNIKDEDVLKCASGGLALEGIFQTKNTDDVFKKREPLLCIPEGFQLLGPEQSPLFRQKEFTSQMEESIFQKAVEKIGLTLSGSVNFSFMGFGLKSTKDYSKDSESDTTSKNSSQQTYVCTTRYNYIPLASCYFTKDQTRLSQAALTALKDIENLIGLHLDEQVVRTKCTDFFQRFGSHANQGPIHFGGIYWWKASMEGITSNQVQEAKRMTSEALNLYVGASYAGNGGDFDLSKSNTQGSIDRSTISKFQKDIQFFSTKTGGPPEVDSLFHWRSGLVTNNKTWSIIDRGFQLLPVWEMIVSNHSDNFTDASKLSLCLIESYTLSTGLTSKMMVGENLVTALEKTKMFLQEVKSWKAEDSDNHLKALIDFKQMLSETTQSYSAWVNLCLSDKGLQEFLLGIVKKYHESKEKDVYLIKMSLQELLETHIYSVDNFLDVSFIMRWIYNSEKNELDQIYVSEFNELIDILQKSKENVSQVTFSLSSGTEEQHQAKIKATQYISLSLSSFLKIMRKMKQKDVELLVLLIANNFGYCVINHYFRNLFGCKDIEFLQRNMEEVYKEFTNLKGLCAERAQAFVLYTGLTSTGEYKEMTWQQKTDRLDLMKSHLEGCISSNVDKIIHQHSDNIDWSKMEDDLRAFAYGSVVKKEFSTNEIAKELGSICQEEIGFINTDEQTDSSTIDKDFLELLKRLDLVKYYPQKMKTADFHKIFRSSLSGTQTSGENQLYLHYLQRLIMLDYRARYIHCKTADDLSHKNIMTITENDKNDTSDNFLEDFLDDSNEESESQNASSEHSIHPMDMQMAIFFCANDFMRQYIYTKLSICQFALPLLVSNPDTKRIEFPLWCFQEVKKNWKTKSGAKTDTKSNSKFITDAETPIVSFIRFGPSSSSKSQIINWLMSKQRHDLFYHRHCKGSTKTSLLMNGIAEIAWYCPGGKDDDAFDDCIAFTNLHGDAREHDKQVQFLEEISSVIVVLFNDSDARDQKGKMLLQQLLKSPIPLLCLLADKENTPPKPGSKLKIGLKDRNEADLICGIATAIQSLLTSSNQRHSLYKCANIARRQGFMVDVDKEQCKQGKDQAEVLLSLLKEKNAMKEEFLPLQGDLWHRWCKKDKELTRLKRKNNVSIEQQRSDIESQKQTLRNKQLEKAFPLNDFMRSFLQILHSNAQGSKLYFLQWFKMFLDDLSSETLSALYEKYHNVWSELEVEKQKGKNKHVIKKIEDNLEQLSTKINISTFGFEHILRELGQIYEGLETFPEKDKSFFTLPKIAAHLMVSGYPVELMDGDAAHVPLKWIGAVLEELIELIGDKKLYVLSVLGIQSTGKSTLLNAMFGLQFAVSAGRCTRGAFMQLIKVDEEMKPELNFEYVLVVDTEGLRAVELSKTNSVNHDNELATFVIGLGNITVINIFGETPSEMQDILQIAVQAFLRMKQVNLRPSCLFVHQNVGEITAKEKNMEGRRRLQENLDKMTLCAAQQEQCDVTCFNNVIQFDVNNHIHYFAHLWEGDPPMAPPNPSYSENVQELKKIILYSGKQKDQANILSISKFKTRVTDLWNALLNENFVFSFKNSLEIAAYNKMNMKNSQWAWSLREHMLTLQNKINNQIYNDVIKSVDIASLTMNFEGKYKEIQKDLNSFFTEDKDSELLVQWRANAEHRLSDLKSNLIEQIQKRANELFRAKENSKKINCYKEKYEDELFEKSKKLALILKGRNLKDEELEEKFNDLWNALITKVTSTIHTLPSPNIYQDLDDVFLDRYKTENNLVDTIRDSYKWKDFLSVFSDYIRTKQNVLYKIFSSETLKPDDQNKIKNTTYALMEIINNYIEKKEQEKTDYQSIYFYEILNTINMEINNMLDNRFKYLTEYRLCVSLFLCQRAAKKFKYISDAFRKANNPIVHLNSKKNEFWQSFKNSCKKTQKTASLAEFLCNILKKSIQQEVTEKAAIQLAGDMKSNDPSLNGNRSKLEYCLLKSLAEKECFQDYINYIRHPKSAVEGFIKGRVHMNCREKAKISKILNIKVDSFRQLISNAIDKSTVEVTDKNGNVESWLKSFCQGLENEMKLSLNDLKSVQYQNITDILFLKEAMTKALQIVVKSLKDELSEYDVNTLEKKTFTMLCDQLSGCWKQCPFCYAICTHTESTHEEDHSMQFHRPIGLAGWHFYNTNIFSTGICTTYVGSNEEFRLDDKLFPFKEYKNAGAPYNEWSITPDNSPLSYWKWVTCRFQSDFEKHYNYKFEGIGEIPSQWRNISKQDAIREIEKCSHLKKK